MAKMSHGYFQGKGSDKNAKINNQNDGYGYQ